MDANHKRTRRLAIYLVAIACLQIAFYLVWSSVRGPAWLFLFDPRLGTSVFESTMLERELEGFPILVLETPIAIFLVFSVLPYGTAVRILTGSPADLSIAPTSPRAITPERITRKKADSIPR